MTNNQTLSEEELKLFERYKEHHSKLFKDRVVQSFYQNDNHVRLLVRCLDGDAACILELEETFRMYFFEFRFVKYLASTIRFVSIDLMRNNQKYKWRNRLVFDSPHAEQSEITVGEQMLSKKATDKDLSPRFSYSKDMTSTFTNDHLRTIFEALSEKQRLIATLAYGMCYQDNEIAKLLKVSPQAISKTRNKALEKLRYSLAERG